MRSLSDRKGAAWGGLVGVSMLLALLMGAGLGMMCFVGVASAAVWGLVLFTTNASYDAAGNRYVDGKLDPDYKPKGGRSGHPTDKDSTPRHGRGRKE